MQRLSCLYICRDRRLFMVCTTVWNNIPLSLFKEFLFHFYDYKCIKIRKILQAKPPLWGAKKRNLSTVELWTVGWQHGHMKEAQLPQSPVGHTLSSPCSSSISSLLWKNRKLQNINYDSHGEMWKGSGSVCVDPMKSGRFSPLRLASHCFQSAFLPHGYSGGQIRWQ